MIAWLVTLCRFIALHGPMLLAGATALLMLGGLVTWLHRSPVHRQRLGELTVGLVLLWAALACLPLPRLSSPLAEADVRPAPRKPVTPALDVSTYTGPPFVIDDNLVRAIAGDSPIGSPGGLEGLDVPPPMNAVPHAPPTLEPSAPPVEPAGLPADRLSCLPVLYLAGAAASILWLALGRLLLVRMTRAAAVPEPWLAQLFDALLADESSMIRPRLLVSPTCARPFSCGLLCPTVALPADCARPANAAQLRNVLLHELAHVRRRDAWGNALLNLTLPLLWFHPLYWWLRSHVCLARELVADDWAAARTDRRAYVADLVALARARSSSSSNSSPFRRLRIGPLAAGTLGAIGVFGMFKSATDFYRRMHMLIDRRHALPTRCSVGWRLGCCAAAAAVLSLATAFVGVPSARGAGAAANTAPPAAGESGTGRPSSEGAAASSSSSSSNRIDAYLLRKLQNLQPGGSPAASRRSFVRRMFLDLTGQVPSADEEAAFVSLLDGNQALARVDDKEADGGKKPESSSEKREGEDRAGGAKEKPADGQRDNQDARPRRLSGARAAERQAVQLAQEREVLQQQLAATQARMAALEKQLAEAKVEREEPVGSRAQRTVERRAGLQRAQAEQAATLAARQELEEAQAEAQPEAQRTRQQALAEAQRARAEAQVEIQRAQAEAQRARAEAQAEAARAKAERDQMMKMHDQFIQQRDQAAQELQSAREQLDRQRSEAAAAQQRAQLGRQRSSQSNGDSTGAAARARYYEEWLKQHPNDPKAAVDLAQAREELARAQAETQAAGAAANEAKARAARTDPFAAGGGGGGGGARAQGGREGGAPQVSVGRGELDLVNLATSYSDAVGAVRVAKARYARAEAEAKDKGQSAGELAVEQANLDGARSKAELLRTIAQIALEGARSELDVARRQVQGGLAPLSQSVEAEAKVKILQRILDASSGRGEGEGNDDARPASRGR